MSWSDQFLGRWTLNLSEAISCGRGLIVSSLGAGSKVQLLSELQEVLPSHLIIKNQRVFVEESSEYNSSRKHSEINHSKKRRGEYLLAIYFSLLRMKSASYLELAPHRVNLKNSLEALWKPGSLSYSFGSEFRSGLLSMYEETFMEAKAGKGISKTLSDYDFGLEGLNKKAKSRFRDLIFEHLGDDLEAVEFKKAHLIDSSKNFLSFLSQEKKKIPKDFMAFGIMLGSLYLSLSKVDKPLNVRRAYYLSNREI